MCMAAFQIHFVHLNVAVIGCRPNVCVREREYCFDSRPDPNDSTAPARKERDMLIFKESRGSFEFQVATGKFSATKE